MIRQGQHVYAVAGLTIAACVVVDVLPHPIFCTPQLAIKGDMLAADVLHTT